MIYTFTYNPSIDYLVFIDKLDIGKLNRARREAYYYGGKGVNVSQVLNELNVDNTALGFVAGFTGLEIENGLRSIGCKTDFVHLPEGHTRINIKLHANDETEINSSGPIIDAFSMKEMYTKLNQIGKDDILVLAGNSSTNMGNDSFASLIASLPFRDTKIILDTTGEALMNCLAYHPFLIKPNIDELSDLFHEEFTPSDSSKIIEAAKHLQLKGARNVLVSMGEDGAILVDENGIAYSHPAPAGVVVNTVGAGDSMVAGFIAGYLENGNIEDAFIMGISAGSATSFNEGLAKADDILQLYRLIR